MYAEALVKNIMGALFPANNVPASNKSADNSGFDMSFGYDPNDLEWWKKIPGLAEGGPVIGPGTATSDSIFAALSNGEFVINAAAVKQVGLNALHRINSGRAFDIPMPRFAAGGLVGEGGAQNGIPQFASDAMANSMGNLSKDISTSFNPTINNNTDVRIDGEHLAGVFRGMIKTDVKNYILNNITQIVMLAKRTGKI